MVMATSSGDEVDRVVGDWQRELPGLDVSSAAIVVPVKRLAALLAERRTAVLAPHGLDQSHLDVLGVLLRLGQPLGLGAGRDVHGGARLFGKGGSALLHSRGRAAGAVHVQGLGRRLGQGRAGG